jgi:hypothetical protein
MYQLIKKITVKNKNNEIITIDPKDKLTFQSTCVKINTHQRNKTNLVEPAFTLTVNQNTDREYYITPEQLKHAFVALPKAIAGVTYEVIQDSTSHVKIVNSSPDVSELPKGTRITCKDNFLFTLENERQPHYKCFHLDNVTDGSYFGSAVYFDPTFYREVA